LGVGCFVVVPKATTVFLGLLRTLLPELIVEVEELRSLGCFFSFSFFAVFILLHYCLNQKMKIQLPSFAF